MKCDLCKEREGFYTVYDGVLVMLVCSACMYKLAQELKS